MMEFNFMCEMDAMELVRLDFKKQRYGLFIK